MHFLKIIPFLIFSSLLSAQPSYDKTGWINALDYGASGSSKELMVSTSEGSNKIYLKNTGDFKEGQGVTMSKCNPHFDNFIMQQTYTLPTFIKNCYII